MDRRRRVAWRGLGEHQPTYYGYGAGGNVYYENNAVYANGQAAGTPEQYYQSTQAIAAAAPPVNQANPQDEWLPLGVYAVTAEDTPDSSAVLQLAVNKQGVLAGTYYNEDTQANRPVQGMIDTQSQRGAEVCGWSEHRLGSRNRCLQPDARGGAGAAALRGRTVAADSPGTPTTASALSEKRAARRRAIRRVAATSSPAFLPMIARTGPTWCRLPATNASAGRPSRLIERGKRARGASLTGAGDPDRGVRWAVFDWTSVIRGRLHVSVQKKCPKEAAVAVDPTDAQVSRASTLRWRRAYDEPLATQRITQPQGHSAPRGQRRVRSSAVLTAAGGSGSGFSHLGTVSENVPPMRCVSTAARGRPWNKGPFMILRLQHVGWTAPTDPNPCV